MLSFVNGRSSAPNPEPPRAQGPADRHQRGMTAQDRAVFHRGLDGARPRAVRGQGAFVVTADGSRVLDAASGAFVAILGFDPPGVADRIAAAMRDIQFAYSGSFGNAEEVRLASLLVERAPAGMAKVWLTTSGSTANETAVKLAHQYHALRGNPSKVQVISRWHSYHGSTIGAMSLSGSVPRRRPFQPYLLDMPHVAPPDCWRCPLARSPGPCDEGCDGACADLFEAEILRLGAEHVSAVIVEPVAGAPLGALVSSPAYLRRLRAICDRHDVLMIADEIVSGMGRTGDWFAIADSGVSPDLITLAKGLGGGFVPIGAVIAHRGVVDAFEGCGAAFTHGESFTGHRVMAAAGCAVVDFIEDHALLSRVRDLDERLSGLLSPLGSHPLVGRLRGRGLLRGVELVADATARRPFPRAMAVSERVLAAARRRGVLFQGGNAGVDGRDGDTIAIAPPYVIADQDLEMATAALREALDEVAAEVGRDGSLGGA